MTKCPEEGCGVVSTQLGNHWQHRPSHRPELSNEQRDIITGMLMSDACIARGTKNPYVKISSSSEEYLHWIDNKFGTLGCGVSVDISSEEIAKRNRESGFSPNADESEYSNMWVWRSRTHPDLRDYRNWYESGKKVWPEDIQLTSTVLTHWYVGDGSRVVRENRSDYIKIAMANERDNLEKVNRYFDRVELDRPSRYNIGVHENGVPYCNASFSVKSSNKMWSYMNFIPPGFEYKWSRNYK